MLFVRNLQYNLTLADHRELLRSILMLLEPNKNAVLLDIGCNDGSKSLIFANKVGTKTIFGIDIIDKYVHTAMEKGIKTVKCNIEDGFPFKAETFDVVTSNQVIEHLYNTDVFIDNVYRVLKKGDMR